MRRPVRTEVAERRSTRVSFTQFLFDALVANGDCWFRTRDELLCSQCWSERIFECNCKSINCFVWGWHVSLLQSSEVSVVQEELTRACVEFQSVQAYVLSLTRSLQFSHTNINWNHVGFKVNMSFILIPWTNWCHLSVLRSVLHT